MTPSPCSPGAGPRPAPPTRAGSEEEAPADAGLTVLVDDVRSFRDGRPCRVARSSAAAVALLLELRDQRVEHLWLDHDLVGDDDIWPVVRLLEDAHERGRPLDLGVVHVHASRSGAAHQMLVSLRRAGYVAVRSALPGLWTWS